MIGRAACAGVVLASALAALPCRAADPMAACWGLGYARIAAGPACPLPSLDPRVPAALDSRSLASLDSRALASLDSRALASLDAPLPELVLAQRAIERSWGPSEDSLYRELEVPDWRSEGAALALSAAVPGAGQWYAGEGSGVWYALAEVAGWTARFLWDRRADELQDEAAAFAGTPTDSASTWSFERWSDATGMDADDLMQLYAADPGAFYETISRDDAFLAGWAGDAAASRGAFRSLRDRADDHSTRARWAGAGLWLNHAVAAVDALRAARLHNLPLRRNLDLELESSWRKGRPGVMAVLRRRF